VRDTPKLLLATLTTLILALTGFVAGPAAAGQQGNSAGHGKAARKPGGDQAGQRAAPRQARADQRAARRQARANQRAVQRANARRHAEKHDQTHANRDAGDGHTTPATAVKPSHASSAATIAAVLATPCQDTVLTPTSEDIPRVRASVLCLINRVRAEHNLQPLSTNRDLEAAAEGHASELVAEDYFAHVSPSGVTPVERIKSTGYIPDPSVGYVVGENLAWGTFSLSTPQSIVEAWVASPGHLANILESRYTETGIGVTGAVPPSLGEGNPGATYAEEFGVIVR
jgi:uncharacterized protein YkwD